MLDAQWLGEVNLNWEYSILRPLEKLMSSMLFALSLVEGLKFEQLPSTGCGSE